MMRDELADRESIRGLDDRIRRNEHFFVISVGKALEWGAELKRINPKLSDAIEALEQALPDGRLIRNMREHDLAYFKGTGHKQEEFVQSLNGGLVEVDGSSTVVGADGYLIGGRLSVQVAIAHAAQCLRALAEL